MPTRHDLAATLKRLLNRALRRSSLQSARRNARRVTADSFAYCPAHLAGTHRATQGPDSVIGFYRSEAFAEDLIEPPVPR